MKNSNMHKQRGLFDGYCNEWDICVIIFIIYCLTKRGSYYEIYNSYKANGRCSVFAMG